uniref:Uncharacterized protein n=1 Tax=Anopheles albimanus TaxID=7167 RepID=A0A182FGI1_ANOAL
MRTIVAIGALVVLVMLVIAAGGSPTSTSSGKPGRSRNYAGGYGGYGVGGYGHGPKIDDVELFFQLRNKLIEVATNAIGFSPLASLNSFNREAFDFEFKPPGKLSVYVREVEKEPPKSSYYPSSSHHYPGPTYGGSYGGSFGGSYGGSYGGGYRSTGHNKPSKGRVPIEE